MAPEFPITCIIGSDIRTPETSFHGENGLDEQLDIVYVDRDGTMRMASLVAIEKLWEKNQPLKGRKNWWDFSHINSPE